MISQKTVWEEIWPVVEALLEATFIQKEQPVAELLVPGGEAAQLYDLFGSAVFDILLKSVLGRSQLSVTRAIQTEGGRYVHIEYVWPDPDEEDGAFTAADLVTVQLEQYDNSWRILSINPAAADFPLTEARAQGVLVTSEARSESGELPREPWILPVALFAGSFQLSLRDGSLADEVEALLLPGLQERRYGVLSLLAGRRLWRDFKEAAAPPLEKPAAWAAATEFVMSEQTMRELTQGAVGKHYRVSLSHMLPRLRQLKETLEIHGLDERYSALASKHIVLKDDGNSTSL